MEMRQITAPGVADGGDPFAAPDILMRFHQHLVDMSIVGLHVSACATFFVSVEDDNDVSPTRAAVARSEDTAIGDGVNGIAEIAVLAADAVQVVAEMLGLGEGLRVISEGAVLASEGEIETGGTGEGGKFKGRGKLKGGVDFRGTPHFWPKAKAKDAECRHQENEEHRQHDAGA